MNYVALNITHPDATLREVAVAVLGEMPFETFEEYDGGIKCYIAELNFDALAVESVLAEMGITPNYYSVENIPHQNWNEEWEKSYTPIVVGSFAGVRAPFHPPNTDVEFDLVISPKMSFGTGHHPTTAQCLALMQEIDFTGKRVFDFGTGTGVLGILALKLSASFIDANDVDDWVIDNANENFTLNGFTENYLVTLNPLSQYPANSYDIVLANINKNVIMAHLAEISRLLKPKGTIIFSGFFDTDLPDITAEATKHSIIYITHTTLNNWAAAKFIKQ